MDIISKISKSGLDKFRKILSEESEPLTAEEYIHWDDLRRRIPPKNLPHEEWWAAIKFKRMSTLKEIPLKDKKGNDFLFTTPEMVNEQLHNIDMYSGGMVAMGEPITNPQTRDKYLVNSLIQEAITSSQLEGAATTREVAKEMIRSGRSPRDKSEQMIFNNYFTMQRIIELKNQPLSLELIFNLHKLVTDKTLDDPTAAGRFRNTDENIYLEDSYGETVHIPPAADELIDRINLMCKFANEKGGKYFIHPVVRAIILHFWLAYDHPFIDGNGRTARALFYWAMLNKEYWLFEYISISQILIKAPIKYARSFLLTETDENDTTYFIIYQIEVIKRAIKLLKSYIKNKTKEISETEILLKDIESLNHRQYSIISHALRHPRHRYTISSHRKSHNVAYDTARHDLLKLSNLGFLNQKKMGKKILFDVKDNLLDVIRDTSSE